MIGPLFTRETGFEITFSYGATAQLARQIENGAPFDLFAAADTRHVDTLVQSGKLLRETRAIYARGRLAVWLPPQAPQDIDSLAGLASERVRYISVANPKTAPYGAAAIEALQRSGVWGSVEAKLVYATDVGMAKQHAATGNADAAILAYSLVTAERGRIISIDAALHQKLDQALAVVASSRQQEGARRFTAFLLHGRGREILLKAGYLAPLP